MDITPIERVVKPWDVSLDRLAESTALTPEQKAAEVSRQFESILIKEILKETWKTPIPSLTGDESVANEIYKDLIINQLADNISKSGSFGIAQTFERQLTSNIKLENQPKPERKNDR